MLTEFRWVALFLRYLIKLHSDDICVWSHWEIPSLSYFLPELGWRFDLVSGGWFGISLLTWCLHMTRLGYLTVWWSCFTWWQAPPRLSMLRIPDRSCKTSNDLLWKLHIINFTISICERNNGAVQIQMMYE